MAQSKGATAAAHSGQADSSETKDGKSRVRSARCIALIGPYLSGKTTLLEAILARGGAITRQGTIKEKTTAGDSSEEAREHGMSVELNIADCTYLGDKFTFIDCPGSVEFQHEAANVLAVADAAIVVCEPDPKRVASLQVILKQLDAMGLPHVLFLNKIDSFDTRVRDVLADLQPASAKPLVLRQIPIWDNGIATGFVDLALERAFVYREHAASEVIELPQTITDRKKEARFHMLEQLADYDDALMEQLLTDIEPPRDRVFDDLALDFRKGLIVPVLLGSAENGNGIVRLLKVLRHEAPFLSETAERLGWNGAPSVHVLKTTYSSHGGKLSVARVLAGEAGDGTVLTGPHGDDRVAGVFSLTGAQAVKRGAAAAGETVALGRLEHARTGDTLAADGGAAAAITVPDMPPPVYAVAIVVKDRKDEVKLSSALARLHEEDPALSVELDKDTHQLLLRGQGEMHLRVSLERLRRKYGVDVERKRRLVPYKETIRASTTIRGRHKKQSGGHGQFGDVVVEIQPLPRGSGFQFDEKVVGGAVPRQYIPSVEIGVAEYLKSGPLGFPVVDVAVTLKDGSFHTVDSSDMAFRQAGRIAMADGLPKCDPVLLEPVMHVEIAVPNDATSTVTGMVSQRRGRILGFNPREDWPGWDLVDAQLPASEMDDLIVELRSATAGVGSYTAAFAHLSELTGKLAEQVLANYRSAAA